MVSIVITNKSVIITPKKRVMGEVIRKEMRVSTLSMAINILITPCGTQREGNLVSIVIIGNKGILFLHDGIGNK